jgi:hypothetical protein
VIFLQSRATGRRVSDGLARDAYDRAPERQGELADPFAEGERIFAPPSPAPSAIVHMSAQDWAQHPPMLIVQSDLNARTVAHAVRVAGEPFGVVGVTAESTRQGIRCTLQWGSA